MTVTRFDLLENVHFISAISFSISGLTMRWSFSWSTYESVPVRARFSSCTLNNTKGFHGRMFSSSASSAWSVDYMGWKWWYCLWACCSTASDSFGGRGDDCFTIRGMYWSAERGFLSPVIKIFTKGKQKGQIRGKQLLVRNSRTEWLVFALLGPFFPQVLSLDSPYGLLVLHCCKVQLAT